MIIIRLLTASSGWKTYATYSQPWETDENELYRMIKRIRSEEGVLWVDSASIVTRKKVLSTIIEDNKER